MTEISIILTGQILLQHNISLFPGGKTRLNMLRNLLDCADIVFSNFESAIIYPNSQAQRNNMFQHDANPEILDIVKFLGFNILSTSNNHTGDRGEFGFNILHEELNKRNIVYVGSGMNIKEASSAKYIKTKNGLVGFIAVASNIPKGYGATSNSAGVFNLELINSDNPSKSYLNPEDLQRVLLAISLAKRKAKYVVLYHHNHYGKEVEVWRQLFAKECIDTGADIYMSHGMPYLMGIEIYKRCPIFYGLGNLYFQTATDDNYYNKNVWESIIVRLEWGIDNIKIYIKPIILNEQGYTKSTHFQTRGQPSLCNYSIGYSILYKIAKLSSQFGTKLIIHNNQSLIII